MLSFDTWGKQKKNTQNRVKTTLKNKLKYLSHFESLNRVNDEQCLKTLF